MKKPVISLMFALASASALPAAVTISALVHVPNGTAAAAGGSGAGTATGELTTTPAYTFTSDRALPITTYSVSNVNLTSVGGTANESFTFTVTYSQTGGTGIGYSAFGNVAVLGNSNDNTINGSEVLTTTVALGTSSFAGLSLTGFTQARVGGMNTAGETGTFTHGGGSVGVSQGNTTRTISGTSFTFGVDGTSTLNLEGYTVGFSAVPEPASASLLALGALALLRRRRTA